MNALLLSVITTALLGSMHCAGMCGGFVCFYAGQESTRSQWPAHLAYNLGRWISYVTLGALAGLLGSRLDMMGAAAGVSRGAAVVVGALMVVWGAAGIARALGARWATPRTPSWASGAVSAVLKRVAAQPPVVRALTLGLLTTLLPCGFLWAYVAIAAGTAMPLRGALVMTAFWASTLPVMLALGVAARSALGPLRQRLPLATASVLVVLGLLTMAGKFRPAGERACPMCDPAPKPAAALTIPRAPRA